MHPDVPETARDETVTAEMADAWRPFLSHFELEPQDLERLALFLLAHAQLDRWLVHATAIHEFSACVQRGVPVRDVDQELDELVSQHAKGTFWSHMDRARRAGLLTDLVGICEEVNEARNRFLHWEPGRFKVPVYQEQAITTEAGFLRCLSDIDKVVVALKDYIDT